MSLKTKNNYSELFLEKRRLMLDSDILIDISDDKNETFNKINEAGYKCIICSPSIIEVGLGKTQEIVQHQLELSKSIYDKALRNPINSLNIDKILNQPETFFVYNPSPHEWLAAKMSLIYYIDELKPDPKNYQKLQFDSIIYNSAWNTRSAILTNNTKDFTKFNEYQKKEYRALPNGTLRYLPLFTLKDFIKSLDEDVYFPENLKYK